VFDAYGVHEVKSLDEMADTMELFSAPRRVARAGGGIASVHDSGGERALFADLAADEGAPFAAVSEATLARVAETLDPGLDAGNPLDAWGTGIDADRIFRDTFLAFAADPSVAAMAFVVDLTRQGEPYDAGYLQVAKDVWAATEKPFCVLSNLASAVAQDEATMLRDAGIPVLEGTVPGLRALKHLLDDAAFRERPAASVPEGGAGATDLPEAPITEIAVLGLLANYGIPVVRTEAASSWDEAEAAAHRTGYPVALKTGDPKIQHKTEADGVRLNIRDVMQLRSAYDDLSGRLGPAVTVAAMAPPGVEVALGVVNDATFGPLVVVAGGGVLVEVLKDRKLALPPLDEAAAMRLIDGLAIRPILDGVRGAAPADVGALAHAISRLSVLAAEVGDQIEALDVNPVIVSPTGCVAVDALILPRER